MVRYKEGWISCSYSQTSCLRAAGQNFMMWERVTFGEEQCGHLERTLFSHILKLYEEERQFIAKLSMFLDVFLMIVNNVMDTFS